MLIEIRRLGRLLRQNWQVVIHLRARQLRSRVKLTINKLNRAD
jgi:hypothetical protein